MGTSLLPETVFPLELLKGGSSYWMCWHGNHCMDLNNKAELCSGCDRDKWQAVSRYNLVHRKGVCRAPHCLHSHVTADTVSTNDIIKFSKDTANVSPLKIDGAADTQVWPSTPITPRRLKPTSRSGSKWPSVALRWSWWTSPSQPWTCAQAQLGAFLLTYRGKARTEPRREDHRCLAATSSAEPWV